MAITTTTVPTSRAEKTVALLIVGILVALIGALLVITEQPYW